MNNAHATRIQTTFKLIHQLAIHLKIDM